MDDSAVVIFGQGELRPLRRELLIGGQLRHLPPRAFALLLHLARQRHRVVPKQELLDAVWGSTDVSDNVLARTVMVVRQALGDSAEAPRLLRTVHRVGYRLHAVDAAAASPSRPAATRPRLAWLPVRNDTGDPGLDWAIWGLPLLCARELMEDERFSVLANETVQHALATLGGSAADPQDEARLRALLGVEVLVQTRLARQGPALTLDYSLQGMANALGQLQEADVSLLSLRLVQALERALLPAPPWRHAGTQPADPLVRQALGRATAVSAQEHWDQAARLLRVVLDVCPDDLWVHIQYLRALANLVDPQALAVGEEVLRLAQARQDPRLIAAAHEACGRAILNLGGPEALVRSQRHLDAALALTPAFEEEDWVCRVYLGQAIGAEMQRDYPRAERFYRLAARANATTGNRLRETVILSNQAVLACHSGELLLARERGLAALALCTEHGLTANLVDVLGCLALTEAGLGLWDSALGRCEAAQAKVQALPRNEHDSAAWVALIAGWLTLEGQGPRDWHEAAMQCMGALDLAQPRVALTWSLAKGLQAELADQPAQADARWDAALAALSEAGHLELVHLLLRWRVGLWRHRGQPADLAAWQATAQALPAWAEDRALQAAWHHALAAQAMQDGRPDEALAQLQAGLALAPSGHTRHLLATDAAGLLLAQGRLTDARLCLQGLGCWLEQHPLGRWLVQRLDAAQAGPVPAPADPAWPPPRLPSWNPMIMVSSSIGQDFPPQAS